MTFSHNFLGTKKSFLREKRFFSVDPAGLAPASLGANASRLLHTSRARIHKGIIKQKEPLSQEIPFVAPSFGPCV